MMYVTDVSGVREKVRLQMPPCAASAQWNGHSSNNEIAAKLLVVWHGLEKWLVDLREKALNARGRSKLLLKNNAFRTQ
jgi:hypothetical protein